MNDRLLTGVAAHGLAGTHAPLDADLDAEEVRGLISASARHRLLGLLVAAVADGALRVGDESYETIAAAHESWCHHVLRAERLLLDLVERFDDAGIT